MKTCYRCKQEKLETEFWKCAQKSDGLSTYCIPCNTKKNRQHNLKNPRWKSQKINASLKSRHGITLEHRNEMFKAQDGKCKICGNPMARPHVDHDHETGKIRGLLCYPCNVGIGFLQDSIPNLQAAIAYLTPEPSPHLNPESPPRCEPKVGPQSSPP